MPAHRLAFALVLAGGMAAVLAAPGCSSTSENPEGASCEEAGDDCASCCVDAVGGLAETAFKVEARACVCDDAPFFCVAECETDLCSNDFVNAGCVVCLRTVGAGCMNNHCLNEGCKTFRACLDTCK